MKNKTIGTLFCLAIAIQLSAQSKFDEKGSLSIRWNFPGMIDPLGCNLTMGAEYRLSPHWSFLADAGWIFASPNEGGKVSGYLIRPAARYYPSLRHFFFFEAQFHYKYIQKEEHAWVPYDMQNGIPAYQKYENVTVHAKSYSLNLLCGTQSRLRNPGGEKWDRLNRLKFEYYWGLGLQYYGEAKPARIVPQNNSIPFPDQSFFFLMPKLGITLVYRLVDKSMSAKALP
jgi:hypothetical protein